MMIALYILTPVGLLLFIAAVLEIRAVERRNRAWLRMSAALAASDREHPLTASHVAQFRKGVWEDE